MQHPFSESLFKEIIRQWSLNEDFTMFKFNDVEVSMCRQRFDLIRIEDKRVPYLCVHYYDDSSYKCSADECPICRYKFLERKNNMIKVYFHESSYTPDFLLSAQLPVDIEVISIDCGKICFVRYLNVTKISRLLGGIGKLIFQAETVYNAGDKDIYSEKRFVKHAIFVGRMTDRSYFPKKITLVNPPCEVVVINN